MYSNHLLLVGRTEVPSGKPFYNYSLPLFFFYEAPSWLVESLNVFLKNGTKHRQSLHGAEVYWFIITK